MFVAFRGFGVLYLLLELNCYALLCVLNNLSYATFLEECVNLIFYVVISS